jgi:aspartyl protease family protein
MFRSRVVRLARFPAVAGALAIAVAASAAASGDPKPEETLKNHGLKRGSGPTYVLAAESDVRKKIGDAQRLYRQLTVALAQQQQVAHEIQDGKLLAQEMREERILRNQQLRTTNPQNVVEHNMLVARINELNDQLRLIEGNAADPQMSQELESGVARRREAYLQAILDVRQLVDKTNVAYAEAARDQTIQRALVALSSKSKSPLKVDPSREYQANIKLLEKAEKSILTEVVELRHKGGVYEVDVTFNGKVTMPMIFDTGASFTTISADVASRIGLDPRAADQRVELHVADGGVIQASLMTIPSVRVGKFTVENVACAVMPPGKTQVPLLLGQSFHRHFTYKFTPESGRLMLSRVESSEPQAKSYRTKAKTTKSKRSSAAGARIPTPASSN